jgi:hypothetical protein
MIKNTRGSNSAFLVHAKIAVRTANIFCSYPIVYLWSTRPENLRVTFFHAAFCVIWLCRISFYGCEVKIKH